MRPPSPPARPEVPQKCSIWRSGVYDHSFRIDPIVRSLLDTDFYKLLMAQTILRRHPQVETTFGIANRTAPGAHRRRGR